MKVILAIDPGNEESAYCLIDIKTYKPIEFNKIKNVEMFDVIERLISEYDGYSFNTMVIEMIASYGMPVGKEVFDTCVWIGRFVEAMKMFSKDRFTETKYVYRKDEKMNICGSMKAKDSNIRQALIDRFGVVGTKKNQGWFYGFKSDIWAAYAVGITYIDKGKSEKDGV